MTNSSIGRVFIPTRGELPPNREGESYFSRPYEWIYKLYRGSGSIVSKSHYHHRSSQKT